MQDRSRSTRRIVLGLSLLAFFGLAAWLLPTKAWAIEFVRYVRDLGVLGFVLYGLAYVAGTVLLVPGTLLTLGSGFLYGPFWGTILVSPASVAGATIAFGLARSFLRNWVSEQIQRYSPPSPAGRFPNGTSHLRTASGLLGWTLALHPRHVVSGSAPQASR